MKLTVIANINIEQEFDVENREEAIMEMENIELPSGYVEDSFEVVKVLDENGEVIE